MRWCQGMFLWSLNISVDRIVFVAAIVTIYLGCLNISGSSSGTVLSCFFLAPVSWCAFVTIENPLTIICRSGRCGFVHAVSLWNLEKKFMNCSAIQPLFRTPLWWNIWHWLQKNFFLNMKWQMTIIDLFIISTQDAMNLVNFL